MPENRDIKATKNTIPVENTVISEMPIAHADIVGQLISRDLADGK